METNVAQLLTYLNPSGGAPYRAPYPDHFQVRAGGEPVKLELITSDRDILHLTPEKSERERSLESGLRGLGEQCDDLEQDNNQLEKKVYELEEENEKLEANQRSAGDILKIWAFENGISIAAKFTSAEHGGTNFRAIQIKGQELTVVGDGTWFRGAKEALEYAAHVIAQSTPDE